MALSCLTEITISGTGFEYQTTSARTYIRLRAITIPDWIGLQVLDTWVNNYHGLGKVWVTDWTTADVIDEYQIGALPKGIYVPGPGAGGLLYRLEPGVELGLKFCTF